MQITYREIEDIKWLRRYGGEPEPEPEPESEPEPEPEPGRRSIWQRQQVLLPEKP